MSVFLSILAFLIFHICIFFLDFYFLLFFLFNILSFIHPLISDGQMDEQELNEPQNRVSLLKGNPSILLCFEFSFQLPRL